MVDVARAAGVSLATVSSAINGSAPVSAELKARVQAAVAEVGYQVNAVARSLKKGSTGTIGLMITDITNPFFTNVIHSIQDAAHRRGYSVMLCCSDEDPAKERLHLQLLTDRMVDGLIIATAGHTDELHGLWRSGRTPIVLIDRLIEGIEADAVIIDNVAATRDAIRHLVAQGHRRIGIITGRREISTSRERYEGYCQALVEAGLPADEELIAPAVRFSSQDGYGAAMKLLALPDRPTAIFASNNLSAIGLMRAIKDMGLNCPDDVSVACFDDFDWANVFHPRLTTVAQPTQAIGVQATTMLIERLKDVALAPRVIRLKAELRVRDSSITRNT